jgi:hypothetical protein
VRNGRWTIVAVLSIAGLIGLGCGRERKVPSTAPAPVSPHTDPTTAVAGLVQENLEAELAFSPSLATWLGAHNFDDRLDDLRSDAVARELLRRRTVLTRARELAAERAMLRENPRLDLDILEHRVEAGVWELTELRPLERNPLFYIDLVSGALDELVADAAGPPQLAERSHFVVARLRLMRGFLDDARGSLRGATPPEALVRRALEVGHVLRQFISETLPRAVPSDEMRQASSEATRALDDFLRWLERDVKSKPRGEALGRERLFTRLRLSEGLEVAPEDLLVAFDRALRDARHRADEVSRQLVGGKLGADAARLSSAELAREAGKMLEEDHGKPEDLALLAQSQIDAILAFGDKERLLPLAPGEAGARDGGVPHDGGAPRHGPTVADMPPHLWGFLRLVVARPLEKPRDPIVYIDTVGKSWPERRKSEYMRAFNRPQMLLRMMHEIGGHLVFEERNRRAPTTAQKTARSTAFLEGWAHYVEHALVDAGFAAGDLRLRVAIERAAVLRAARAIAAVKFHALGASRDEILRIFTDEAGLDRESADREIERVAVDPMVLNDCLGRLVIEKLRTDWRAAHPDASVGDFHAALLAHGSTPLGLLRPMLVPSGPAL